MALFFSKQTPTYLFLKHNVGRKVVPDPEVDRRGVSQRKAKRGALGRWSKCSRVCFPFCVVQICRTEHSDEEGISKDKYSCYISVTIMQHRSLVIQKSVSKLLLSESRRFKVDISGLNSVQKKAVKWYKISEKTGYIGKLLAVALRIL